jgi:NNP family nitrate/nitrite transporter-like MFS transporter
MIAIQEETEIMEAGNVPAQTPPLDSDPIEQEALRLQREWDECTRDAYKASPQSIYDRYDVPVDHYEGDRATKINFCSIQRPHMRSFHCSWISFFLAFTIWFAPAPLLKEIQDTLNLSKKQVWNSSITNDCTAIFMRVIMGPICDSYGARMPMAIILVLASIPTACVGLIESAAGLALVRFFIGIAGSSFVMAQFWPSRMFSREIAGTANGLVGGWGNLGGAWTQLMMGTILFPAFERYFDGDSERSWRTICVIPASMAFCFGLVLPFISDDAPMGNYSQMKKSGTMDRIFFTTSLRQGATMNTWILFIQYACSFGVELVMNNAAVLYFTSKFGLDTEEASTLGFLYGSMNIFARGLGGYMSDQLNRKYGMRGRLGLQAVLLVLEGIMIIVFSFTDTLLGAVITMCIFSIFTQSAEGAIYGIVPYVSKMYTGSVAGFVGSGGNVGSVVYGLGFRSLPYETGFLIMGCIVIMSSLLSFFINIPCHAGLLWGEDNHAVISARDRFRDRLEMSARGHRAQVGTVDTTSGIGGSENNDDVASTQEMVELGDRTKEGEAASIEDPTRIDVDTESGIPVAPEVSINNEEATA